jgi:geranylgeranyl transferase type-2 subunit beta
MNGTYWGLAALCLLDAKDTFNKQDVVEFVLSCFNEDGGFGSFKNHDSHLLSTLSALQILLIYESLDVLTDEDVAKVVGFIKRNQLENGAFQGDRFGEIDTRFVYTAVQSLAILGKLDDEVVEGAVKFITSCANFDGGYGLVPGAESHAAQVFTCLGTLAIVGRLDLVNVELTGWWLSERQLENGGLNGRPGKLPDVCYSWWVLSSLAIIDKLKWIDFDRLRGFILQSQDEVTGGISDRPDNQVDVFHTLFGIAGLSLMNFENLVPIDPIYCLLTEISATIKKWPY